MIHFVTLAHRPEAGGKAIGPPFPKKMSVYFILCVTYPFRHQTLVKVKKIQFLVLFVTNE